MAADLSGTAIAFLTAPEGTEQIELTDPWEAVRKAGAVPWLVSTATGSIQAFNHLDKGDTFRVDTTVDQVTSRGFTGLVLPGGVANPDYLRTQERAVAFIAEFAAEGKPVAAICHAPWSLIEAGNVQGRQLTSYPSLRTDIINAGGKWTDEAVVVCSNGANTLITSRSPGDLPVFDNAVLEAFAE